MAENANPSNYLATNQSEHITEMLQIETKISGRNKN